MTGTVVDEADKPVAGAYVLVNGTTIGTITDAEGRFGIKAVPADAKEIIVTFLGMSTASAAVSTEPLHIVMKADATYLEDVVVVAYGSARREAMTGSVTAVKGDQIASVPVASVDKALAGKLAGVSVTSSTGQPGSSSSIRIRGTSSINASKNPLWVIDGIPVLTGDIADSSVGDAQSSLMTSLNPNDIESITVLKDAAAAAVYGSRAANGVILVTTKSGKEGRATFDARVKCGVQWFQNDNGFRMMSAEELLGFQRQAVINAGLDPDDPAGTYYRPMSLLTGELTNWMDHMTKLGSIQEYEISARGGNNKAKYFSSASYHRNDGVVYGTNYQKAQARVNADFKLLQNLETGVRLNLAFTDQDNAPTDGFAYENPIFAGMHILPWTPKYNEDGSHHLPASNSNKNPRASADWNEKLLRSYRLNGTMYLKWEPVKNLVAETKNSVEAVFSEQRLYYSEKAGYDNIIQHIDNQIFQLTTSNTINYANVFGGYHSFRALVGQEATRYIQDQNYFEAWGVNPDIPYAQTADQSKTSVEQAKTRDTMLSFFGIVDYNYDNKYFVQATVRGDGSSLFGAKNKWGAFWSASASWNLSNESWMADIRNIDILKIRASYGLNGNNGIAAYRAYGKYGSALYNGIAGMLPSSPENQELSWEKNETWNVGVDFGFFGRLRGSIDVYDRITKDMLLNKSVPQTSGFSSNFMNTGKMRNSGVEFQIDGDVISTSDILWNIGFNIAYNKTEILDLGGEQKIEAATWLHHVVGKSMYSYYLSDYYGVNPSNGEALWVTEEGKLTNDYNKARKYYAGSPEPKFVGGFNTAFTWKGLSLSAFFEYKIGNKILPMNESRYLMSDGAVMNMNQMADALNYWKKPGDTHCNPKPVAGNSSNSNDFEIDRWVQDGSYLRLKDVTVSYALSQAAVKKIRVKGLRFYVSGLNLYTFSDVTAYDPEAGASGVVAAIYPFAKTVVGGIELTF